MIDREPEPVVSVEEPVAEPADDVDGIGVRRDRAQALGELEHGHAVRALRAEADDPPQRHPEGEQRDAPGGSQRVRGRGTTAESLEDEPQRGCDGDEHERRRVDRPDGEEHQREQRGVEPSPVPHRVIVSPTSHGSPAHASRITEIRAVNASWYGVSMYTSAPASAPARRVPSIVNNHRAPSAAASEMVPSQSRCATQSGTPTWSMSQKYGPIGNR